MPKASPHTPNFFSPLQNRFDSRMIFLLLRGTLEQDKKSSRARANSHTQKHTIPVINIAKDDWQKKKVGPLSPYPNKGQW